ncbi:MAG: cytochrome b [Anaerolineales bacterium]|nr:cytochrome b [Anaerolineales bacterium]
MSNQITPDRYHPIHVVLHWLVAIVTIFLLAVGLLVFPNTPNSQELQMLGMHKTAGMFLGLLMVGRLITRFVFKRPAPADAGHPLLNLAGKVVHFLLYIGVFAIMFAGGSLSLAYGLDNILKGIGTIPEDLFIYPQLSAHGNISYILIGLIAMHFGAALYHQFIRRDNLLSRMWFGK